ncbi:GNAT family N-acetyltransferase [Streptomyces kronopolitis]|uniref:GNAT family N-acetyltransferase n=1 Tax=Streptomyces kronopolitis TaxID=1612435 RepID=UPI003F571A9E
MTSTSPAAAPKSSTGCCPRPAARGAGVAVEATRCLSRWALNDLGLHRLRLCHSVANPASRRVADRAGFTLEGTMRSALPHADGRHGEQLVERIVVGVGPVGLRAVNGRSLGAGDGAGAAPPVLAHAAGGAAPLGWTP